MGQVLLMLQGLSCRSWCRLEFEVAEHSKISQEELDALMPHFEVSPTKMSRIEKRIRNRMVAIVIIWIARIIFVSFYPEYHMFTQRQTQVLSAETVNNLLVIRVSLLIIGVTIYCASFYFNRYFRSANVVALILSLIHISEPTRLRRSRMPSSA